MVKAIANVYKEILLRYHPELEIVCPWDLHPNSPTYDPQKAKETLLAMADLAAQCDALVAYIPQASMGTALEMWRAYEAGRLILTISPLHENWVISAFSSHIFPTLDEFEQYLADGRLEADLELGQNHPNSHAAPS